MNRREMLLAAAGATASLAVWPTRSLRAADARCERLGLVVYCLGIRARAERARGNKTFSEPLPFLEHAHDLGAGGIQVPLGVGDESEAANVARRAEQLGMFVEAIIRLPYEKTDVERFEAEVRTARAAGAQVARVVIIPGRRYERFTSAEEFHEFARRGVRALELAEPVAARNRLRLAVENHKDQRIGERIAVLERISSEYVGTCVDTGNSFSLLEDPIEAVRAYAPWAASVHLKDQAVREYDDGFLFADVALGDGFLDLKQMVGILKEANANVHFGLESITRDPLNVPCLTEDYWSTMADVPASELARTLRLVRANAAVELITVSAMSPDEQVRYEEQNVKRSLAYAREHLGL